METSFGVALTFVILTTLFQFALPRTPSTRCGNVITVVDVDTGTAFRTADEGAARKSRVTASAANGFPTQPHLKRICVACVRSAFGKIAAVLALKKPLGG